MGALRAVRFGLEGHMRRFLMFAAVWALGACATAATEPLPRCTLTRDGGVLVDTCR